MYPLVEDMSKIYARPLPRVYAIFLFAIEYSAKAQHTTTGARLTEDGHIFLTCLQLVGTWVYMGAKYFQEVGPIFFDMSSASGCTGKKYVQEFGQKYMPILC